MPGFDQPLLINVLGHAAGAVIFAIFLALLFSGCGWSGSRGRNLSALAAALSLLWNLGSLAALLWPGMPAVALNLVVALSFSVLSVLPAVLLQISLEGSQPALVLCGYSLSAVAVAAHFLELAGNGASLHQLALLVITVGFLLLAGTAAARAAFPRGKRAPSGGGRILASMCLALFAMSFVHFGAGHASHAWSSELVIHHAGIPLALFVLLQDYRFVLLDAFVRFLANAVLAAALAWLAVAAAFHFALAERVSPGPLQTALALIAVGLSLLIFAWLRDRLHTWLTHAVFLRGGMEPLAAALKDAPPFPDELAYLDWAATRMAAALRTAGFAVIPQSESGAAAGLRAPASADLLAGAPSAEKWNWAETVVPIRLAAGDSRLILFGHRQGGRRYLGEDLDALARAAGVLEERLESMRRQELDRLVAQAELRALEAQINPHFLFNALNALYGAIPREAQGARRMVLNLADIFRYFLHSGKTFVPLAEELRIVQAYLEVEQARLGDRLETAIQADDAAREIAIPILSIQPLVENAIKHGIAPRPERGYVRVRAAIENGNLRVTVENSGGDSSGANAGPGVGLQNVRRRLEICYGPAARLELRFLDGKTVVELLLPPARGEKQTQ